MDNVHFSSETDNWSTPQDFFDKLSRVIGFEIDVCGDVHNKKCERVLTCADDGLSQDWDGVCWMNPPYGREIGKWVKKAYDSSLNGAFVCCLLPARTDTAWWQDYCTKAFSVNFLRGRLKFGGSKNSAPFPSALVIFWRL